MLHAFQTDKRDHGWALFTLSKRKVTEDGGLTVHTEMKPLGQLTIATHGRGELVSGSVRVVSDGPIGGVLRFDLPEVGVAGVGTSLLKPFTNSAVLPIPRRSNRLGR